MNNAEIIDNLRVHNEWRRGGDGRQPCPTMLGYTIDAAIHTIKHMDCRLELLDGHNVDGITARDKTIKLLDDVICDLKRKNKTLLELVNEIDIPSPADTEAGD